MAMGQLATVVRYLRRLVSGHRWAETTDGQLLERFTSQRDPDAFEALVQRHGPVVLGVCWRILRHTQDAEDVFQATFLVLARKAGSIRRREAVGGWLHRVASHLALKARAEAARRRLHERKATPMPLADPIDGPAWHELRPVLDEELNRLPDKYRLALLLCDLEGKTHAQAAKELACPLGSMSWRVTRGRELLRGRLARRGVALSLGILGPLLATGRTAAVPAILVAKTVHAGLCFATGETTLVALASARALGLAGGMLKVMLAAKLRVIAAIALPVVLALGAGLLARQMVAGKPALQDSAGAANGGEAGKPEPDVAEAPKPSRTDFYGDPLPPGALVRIGTLRWRNAQHVTGLTFSLDGTEVASSAADGIIRSWKVSTSAPHLKLNTGNGNETTLALSPDGRRLATAGNYWNPKERKGTGRIHVWDFASGKQLLKIEKVGLYPWGLAWSPDGKAVACGCEDGSICLWDASTGNENLRFAAHKRDVIWLAFTPDGRTLASASHDQTLRLWDPATGKELRPLQTGLYLHFDPPALSKDGRTLAAAAYPSGGDRRVPVVLWDVAAGKERLRLEDPRYHLGRALAFSPDGASLATVASDLAGNQVILLWDLASAKPRLQIQGISDYLYRLAFAPDGKTLAGGGSGGMVHLWDVATGRKLAGPDVHQGVITRLFYSPDGRTLLTASDDHTVRLWDPATGRQRRKLEGHSHWVRALALSPDGKTVASSSLDDTVRLWDSVSAKELRRLPGHGKSGGTRRLAFLQDGKQLASWGDDQLLRVWNVSTGKELVNDSPYLTGVPGLPAGGEERQRAIERARKAGISELTFTPDGERLVLVSGALSHIVAVATAKELSTFPVEGRTDALTLSPDGMMLLLATHEMGRIVEMPTGKLLLTIGGLATWPVAAFAPDGKSVAVSAGPRQGTIALWELATGKEILRLESPGTVHQLAFAPDGKTLAEGLTDSTALIWNLSPAPPKETVKRQPLSSALDTLWADLAGEDATRAYAAIWTLATTPEKAVDFLKDRLPPAAAPDANQIRAPACSTTS